MIHNIGLVLNQMGLIFIPSILINQRPGDEKEIYYVLAI